MQKLVGISSLLFSILLATQGCGYAETARRHCTISETACNALFGTDQAEVDYQQLMRINEIERELETLTTVSNDLINTTKTLAAQYQTNSALINLLQLQTSNNSDTIQDLVDANQDLVERIDYYSELVSIYQADISRLLSEDSIVEYQDPCGTKPGYFNEILMKTRSGKYVAYFESGQGQGNQNRFLTVLTQGSYQTTDGTKCKFDIDAGGRIVNERY